MVGPRIHAVLRADLRGLTDDYIQDRLSLSKGQLSRIRSSEMYKERLADLQERATDTVLEQIAEEEDAVAAELSGSALKAAQRNVALLDSESEKIVQASAWDILDRTGHPKATKTISAQRASIMIDVDSLKALGEALTVPALPVEKEIDELE